LLAEFQAKDGLFQRIEARTNLGRSPRRRCSPSRQFGAAQCGAGSAAFAEDCAARREHLRVPRQPSGHRTCFRESIIAPRANSAAGRSSAAISDRRAAREPLDISLSVREFPSCPPCWPCVPPASAACGLQNQRAARSDSVFAASGSCVSPHALLLPQASSRRRQLTPGGATEHFQGRHEPRAISR